MARILYIEDDASLATLFKEVVESHGHAVETANVGQAGMALHRADPFDIVVVDYELPGLSGLDVARELLEENPDLFMLMVTGRGNERVAAEAMSVGIANYVIKDDVGIYLDVIPSYIKSLIERLELQRRYAALERPVIEQETSFRHLIENFDHGIFIHRNYHPLFVNNALLRIFGYESMEDLINAGGVDQLYAPHERERLRRYFEERMRDTSTAPKGAPNQYVFEGRRKDGTSIWLQRSSQTVIWDNGPAVLGSVFDISEHVAAEQALRVNEERFRQFIDYSPSEFTLKDLDGNYLMVNHKFREGLSWGEAEHVGKSIYDVLPADAADAALAHEREVAASGISSHVERTLQIRGAERTYFVTKFPVFDSNGMITSIGSINTEISERVRIERSLEQSEQRFRDFAQSASDWFWETDENLRFTYFSERSREITGFEPEKLIGKTRRDITAENATDAKWARHLDDLDNHRPFRDFRYDLIIADGSVMTLSTSGVPIFDADGNFRGYRGTGSDITERRRATEARDQAMREAERASRAKSEFLATMSHEFRTPLNAILGFSEILRSQLFGPLGAKHYEEYAADIHASGTHMLALINDILDIAAIEAGKRPLTMEAIDLEFVFRESLKNFKLQADAKDIRLSLDIATGLPNVLADKRSLFQMVQNLLSNAVKFTGPDGDIVLSARSADGQLTVQVSDSGIGIPSDTLPGITEPFAQSKTDPHITQTGTGLGLSIVKSLIEAHDGTLTIDSLEGTGTTVTLIFPATRLVTTLDG